MDAVSLALAKNYTNEKLNSLPSNRPNKTVNFDGGIYSVGNDVVNGQVSDVAVKGQTWINRAGVGDTSPQTVSNLDITKTYLLINDAGANVTIDTIDTPTPVKLTGDTEFDFVWASGKIALYELSAEETALDASVLGQKYHYVSDTKSTNSVRVKSVGKNLFSDSEFNPSYWTKIGDGEFCNKIQLHFNPPHVRWMKGKFKANTVYTIKYSIKAPTGKNPRLKVFYTDGTSSGSYLGSTGEYKTQTLVTKNGKTVDYIGGEYTASCDPGTLVIKDIQVEEGSVATEYEPYKKSIVNVNLPEPLRSLPNGVNDEFNVRSGIKTQRVGNKTNVASGTAISYADMATGGQFVAYYADGTQQVGAKGDTLTADAISLTYQLAEPIVTKLPAQPPLQVFENGTVYVEPIGDVSESTLPTVELTIPTGNSNKFGVASHDYDGAAADWVLTNSESKCFLLAVSSAGDAANIIAPDAPGAMYAISNASEYTITIKISGGNGVDVNTGKKVLVIHDGTDYVALTAEL